MVKDEEVFNQAAIAELQRQRDEANNRLVNAQATIAVLSTKLAELEKSNPRD